MQHSIYTLLEHFMFVSPRHFHAFFSSFAMHLPLLSRVFLSFAMHLPLHQGLGLPEVFDLLTHAAVVVTLPGLGAALVPVLRANSVLVHLVHHPGAAFDHRYVPTWIDHLAAFAVNVSAVQLTAQDAQQLVVREAALDAEAWFVRQCCCEWC